MHGTWVGEHGGCPVWFRHAVLAVLLVVGGCGPGPVKIRHPPNLAEGMRVAMYRPEVHEFETTTGMQVLVLPERNTNLVKVDVRYRVGAAEDPPGKSGLAHLVEHMLFEARLDGPDAPTLGAVMSKAALYQNAHTLWDHTHYTSVALSDELPVLLDLEARRMGTGCDRIREEDLARERAVVQSELRQRSSVATVTDRLLRQAVYGEAHPYARPVGGTEAEVAGITRDDVCTFIEAHYGPGAAILVVSGDVEPAKVAAQINASFRGVPARELVPRTVIPAPDGRRGVMKTYTLPVDEASAIIAFPAAPFLSDAYVYDQLLVRILDSHLSAMPGEHDDITSVEVGMTGGLHAPMIVIALSVAAPEVLEDAIALVLGELEDFAKELDSDVLIGICERQRAALLLQVEPFMRKASMFADYVQYADHDRYVIRDIDLLADVRLKALQSRATRQLGRANGFVVAIRPETDERPTAARARVRFLSGERIEGDAHEGEVDVAEAETSLPIPERRVDTKITSFVLDNGLTVLLAPYLPHPVVDIRLVFPAGELHDPPGQPGLSRWALKLLTPNHIKIERARDLGDLISIYKMGGTLARYMDERTTTFRIAGQSVYVDGLLWQLHWLLETGLYRKESVKRARALLRQAGSDDSGDDDRRRMQAVMQTLYGAEHPYAVQPFARPLPDALSGDRLAAFRDGHYRMRGATLIVTGSFDAVLVETEVRRLFGDWAGEAAPPRPRVPDAVARAGTEYLALLDEDAYRLRLNVAFDTRPGFATDHATYLVLREMLRSRLWRLREELAITYDVHVSQHSREGPGLLLVSTEVDREHGVEAYRVMRETLDELRAGEHTAAFVRARRRVLQDLLADALSSTSVANELETIVTYDLPRSYYDDLARRVATLRPADVQAVIDRDLSPAHEVVLVVGDRGTVEALYRAVGVSGYRRVE